MLIEFSVENYRSIKERAVLSMIAAKLRSTEPSIDTDNVITVNDKLALLRSVLIYGANASGKSNLIMAFQFMRLFVSGSASDRQAEDPVRVEPFCLNEETRTEPSTFEVVFLLSGKQYRYGFAANAHHITAEWLYFVPTIREVELFTRNETGIHISDRFREGKGLKERTRENALFLSVVAQFNGEIANHVRRWFVNECLTIIADNPSYLLQYTMDCLSGDTHGDRIAEMLAQLNLGVNRFSVNETERENDFANVMPVGSYLRGIVPPVSPSSGSPKMLVRELRTHHPIRDRSGIIVGEADFPSGKMESQGTLKSISLAGPLIDVLANGRLLMLDEIEAKLHPLITGALIGLFNSPLSNPKRAQLVCATHDTNLLDRRRFRRDQIYFTEKDRFDGTHLYSLAEFKLGHQDGNRSVRNDASFEKDYIEGRYGAIPYIGDLARLFVEEAQNRDNEHASEPVDEIAR